MGDHTELMNMSSSVPYQLHIFLDDSRPAAGRFPHIQRQAIKGRSTVAARDETLVP
jgi:hypothetical protein